MAKEKSQLGLSDLAQRMQAPFIGNGAVGMPTKRFLKTQGSLLQKAEGFAYHWPDRRNDAVKTTIRVRHQMNSTGATAPTIGADMNKAGRGKSGQGRAGPKHGSEHMTPV